MWAHHGGLEFDGRERWDKWEACKGLDTEGAHSRFVHAYGKAMAAERNKENFRAY
jgi:acyl-CoA-binding protein